jgi:hypothetical protein
VQPGCWGQECGEGWVRLGGHLIALIRSLNFNLKALGSRERKEKFK